MRSPPCPCHCLVATVEVSLEKIPWCPCPFKNEAYRPESTPSPFPNFVKNNKLTKIKSLVCFCPAVGGGSGYLGGGGDSKSSSSSRPIKRDKMTEEDSKRMKEILRDDVRKLYFFQTEEINRVDNLTEFVSFKEIGLHHF